MKAKNTTLMGVGLMIGLTLSGCEQGSAIDAVASVQGRAIERQAFDSYLKFKRIAVKDDSQRERVLDTYLEREALAAAIEQGGFLDKALTDAELNEFRKEMLISRYFERYLNETVSDEAVRNYYAQHADQYQERKVHVAHILLRTDRGMGDAERQAKLTTAQEAASKIKSGMSFEEAVTNYSEDTVSAKKGGDLGWLKEGAIDPLFSKTAFSLDVGTVSEPFQTPFGVHIVKLIEGPLVIKQPFEAVSGNIRYQLRNEAKAAELKRLLAGVVVEKGAGK